MMLRDDKNRYSRLVGLWVFTLYFIEGLPFSLVNTVSVVFFKSLQISNSQIGLFTSLFYIPWAIKFLWAPLIDFTGQRKKWLIVIQVLLAIFSFALSLCTLYSQSFITLSILFVLIAFTSATYDVACDGYYLDCLDKAHQSLYIGWRSTAYKLAWLFAAGFLVYLAGLISTSHAQYTMPNNNIGWSAAFCVVAIVFALAAFLHNYILPIPTEKISSPESNILLNSFKEAFSSFFQQNKMGIILAWILLFRAGDALVLKMAQPFLLDKTDKGGLDLSLQTVGFIYGSVGIGFLLLGGIIGGWLVYKWGLKKCLLPTALLQTVTLLLYWLLAIYRPTLAFVAVANAFEQFAYGLATAAYTSYLFTLVKDKYKASHYAIATGFMAIGMIIPGAISGYLVDSIGYQQFFLISFFASMPGIICTLKLPFIHD